MSERERYSIGMHPIQINSYTIEHIYFSISSRSLGIEDFDKRYEFIRLMLDSLFFGFVPWNDCEMDGTVCAPYSVRLCVFYIISIQKKKVSSIGFDRHVDQIGMIARLCMNEPRCCLLSRISYTFNWNGNLLELHVWLLHQANQCSRALAKKAFFSLL